MGFQNTPLKYCGFLKVMTQEKCFLFLNLVEKLQVKRKTGQGTSDVLTTLRRIKI